MALAAPGVARAAPANDDFPGVSVEPSPEFVPVHTPGATFQAGEPFPGDDYDVSVWYHWTSPATRRTVLIQVFTQDHPPACLTAYTGTELDDLTVAPNVLLPCDQFVAFVSEPNTTYYFQVAIDLSGYVSEPAFIFGTSVMPADFSVAQTATSATRVGQTIVARTVITNNGPEAGSAHLDLSADHVQLLSMTCGNAPCTSGDTDIIPVGGSVVVKSRWTPYASGDIAIDATVGIIDTDDPDLTNNTASSTTAVTLSGGDVRTALDDGGFLKPTTEIGYGHTLWWWNDGAEEHTVTDATGLALFDVRLGPEQLTGRLFTAAGVYDVVDDETGEHQIVTVPMKAKPRIGTTTTPLAVEWASAVAPSGQAYEIDVKRPHSGYVSWLTTQSRSATFTPDAGPGIYKMRARLVKPGGLVGTGWVTTRITIS